MLRWEPKENEWYKVCLIPTPVEVDVNRKLDIVARFLDGGFNRRPEKGVTAQYPILKISSLLDFLVRQLPLCY